MSCVRVCVHARVCVMADFQVAFSFELSSMNRYSFFFVLLHSSLGGLSPHSPPPSSLQAEQCH